MADRLKRSLTFANVCSFLALFVAVSTGGAFAANTVFSTDIVDGEVKTEDIADRRSDQPQLGSTPSTRPASSTTPSPGDLADGAVTTDKVLDDTLPPPTSAATPSAPAGDRRRVGSPAATSEPSRQGRQGRRQLDRQRRDHRQLGCGSGDYLASSSMGTSEITDGAVATADLANNSITSAKVGPDLLTTAPTSRAPTPAGPSIWPTSRRRCTTSRSTSARTAPQWVRLRLPSGEGGAAHGVVVYATASSGARPCSTTACNFTGGAVPDDHGPARARRNVRLTGGCGGGSSTRAAAAEP